MGRGLALSVLIGALAAASLPILFLVIATMGTGMTLSDLIFFGKILACILVVSFATVLLSALTLGLLSAFLLRRMGWESGAAYVGVGATGGFLIPLMVSGQLMGFSMLGLFGGGFTGWAWWKFWRRSVVEDE